MSEPFVVEIVSGEALPAKDTSVNVSTRELEHLSDPYVQCELKDAHGNSKGPVRSSVPKLRTLDPVWRFLIDFDVPQGDVMLSDELHIAVYDADMVGNDDLMGCARVSVGSLAPAEKRYVLDVGVASPAAAEADRAAPPSLPGRAGVCTISVRKVPISSLPKKMTLFMVRHGESKWNEAQEAKNVYGMLRQVDHPLDITGIKQCAKLQQKIAEQAAASENQALREHRERVHGQVARTFYEFDADASGYLDESEVAAFCQKLGLLLTPPEVTQALSEMESDGTRDGKIEFEEFLQWWQSDSKTKRAGSIAFRLQQAKEEAFEAELGGNSPVGRLLARRAAAESKSTPENTKSQLQDEPKTELDPSQTPHTLVLTCPADSAPGDTIHIELLDHTLGFEVPDGVAPGDEFEVAIDMSTMDEDAALAIDADGDGVISQAQVAVYNASRKPVPEPEPEPEPKAKATDNIPEATPPSETAVGVQDWLAAQAIYASPLRRAIQTCLIVVKGHPALQRAEGSAADLHGKVPDDKRVPLTLLSSAREIKKLGGQDSVGGSIGGDIVAGALADLQQVAGMSEGVAGGANHRSEIDWEKPADEHVDVFDAACDWWSSAAEAEDTETIAVRLRSFLATLRYHNPTSSGSGSGENNGLRSAIVISHSLFIRNFCDTYATPARASGSLLERLCEEKLANASAVALDVSFGVGAHGCGVDHAKIVNATPIFGTSFAGQDDEDNRTTGAASMSAAEPSRKKRAARSGWLSCCSGPSTD